MNSPLAVIVALTMVAPIALACGGGPGASSPAADEGDMLASGEMIAFVSFREGRQEIYVMNTDGSDQRNLTNDPAGDFDPDWSPDGSQIAFVSDRTGAAQIFVMDAAGSNLRQISRDGGLSPRWSTDGSLIAYSHGGSILIIPGSGGNPEVVLEARPESAALPCRAGAFPGGWSPDGEAIVYYSANVTQQAGQVCTIKPDGSDIQVLVGDPDAYDVEPAWSPDGRYIAYRAIEEGVHDIWVLDRETGERTNLTNDPDLDVEPDWSPDGEWITFGSIQIGAPNFDIFIMRRDGSDLRRLTDDPAKDANPVWSP